MNYAINFLFKYFALIFMQSIILITIIIIILIFIYFLYIRAYYK